MMTGPTGIPLPLWDPAPTRPGQRPPLGGPRPVPRGLQQPDYQNSPYAIATRNAQLQAQQQQQASQPRPPLVTPQTSITVPPEGIYSPRQTQAATSQAIAAQHARGDLRQAMKQFDRPGISRSAGSVAAALPTVMQANTAAAQAATSIPLLDAIANAQHILGAQQARENEAIGMGGLGMRLVEDQTKQNEAYKSAMMQPLLTILSALGME